MLLLSSHTLELPEVDDSDRKLNARIQLKLLERDITYDKCGGRFTRWKRLKHSFTNTDRNEHSLWTNEQNNPTQQRELLCSPTLIDTQWLTTTFDHF